MSDLEELIALAGGPPGDDDQMGDSPSLLDIIEYGDPGATPEPEDEPAPEGDDAQESELLDLVQLGEAPRTKDKR